jgi:hypothetical protein
MAVKTKLRMKLESLKKGGSLRLKGVTSSATVEYRRAQSTIRNIVVSAGWRFKTTLGAHALTITRTK